MNKLCCSKKLVTVSWCATLLLTILSVVGAFFSEGDASPLLTVTGLSWGETATSTGFYYWKAKHEKKLELFERMAEKYGFEAAANLAGIIFGE